MQIAVWIADKVMASPKVKKFLRRAGVLSGVSLALFVLKYVDDAKLSVRAEAEQKLVALEQRNIEARAQITKTADERFAIQTQMLQEIQKDARETRGLVLTLLRESRDRRQALIGPVPRYTKLAPGLVTAWPNPGHEAPAQEE